MCATHSKKTKKGRRYGYDYYTCSHRNRYGAEACANTFRPRAEALEGLVQKGVFANIEDPEREARLWARKRAEAERKRARNPVWP